MLVLLPTRARGCCYNADKNTNIGNLFRVFLVSDTSKLKVGQDRFIYIEEMYVHVDLGLFALVSC